MRNPTPSLSARLHEILSRTGYQPLKQHELARELQLKGSGRSTFRHMLYEMERQGQVVRLRKNRWALPARDRQVAGKLRLSAQGFGFVTPEEAGQEDVFIPRDQVGVGLDGDRVIVRIESAAKPRRSSRTPAAAAESRAGRIVAVVERAHPALAGLLRRTPYYWYVIPDNPRARQNIRVREFAELPSPPAEFSKVVVRLDPWEEAHRPLTGVVVEDLGPADAPGVDVLSVMRDHGLDPDFPAEAARAAEQHPPALQPGATKHRRDLRGELTFTIDPEDARDYDDAVSLTRAPSGGWVLGVHIADVAHFVVAGSSIDREACARGNSVYLVDRHLPMLPPYLTTEVCSLRAGVDRLTHTVEAEIDGDGRVVSSETFRSVIRSSARLTYEQVQALFDGRDGHGIPSPVAKALADMRELARTLRARRMGAGAIDLAIPEIRCVLDAGGRVVEIRKRGASEAYHLIEEFMLVANGVVAGILAAREVPAVYRIHDEPDEEQWARMKTDLDALGVRLGEPTREGLNAAARTAAGTPMQYTVHLAILRNLKRALYSPESREHFGLAARPYTHFTSPIRRFPDLAVHRMLAAVEERRPPPYSFEEAARIASQCSETERNADEAEDESVQVKRIAFYRAKQQRGEIGPFPGVVVGMLPKGLIVELADTLQRGLLPFSALRDDHYTLTPAGNRAMGRRHRGTWELGRKVDVMLARVDTARRRVDFFVPEDDASPPRKQRKKKR